jgi:hypothetical protein
MVALVGAEMVSLLLAERKVWSVGDAMESCWRRGRIWGLMGCRRALSERVVVIVWGSLWRMGVSETVDSDDGDDRCLSGSVWGSDNGDVRFVLL